MIDARIPANGILLATTHVGWFIAECKDKEKAADKSSIRARACEDFLKH